MPHYTEAIEQNNTEKKESRKINNSLGKHDNKHIFKNNGQYGTFYTHDKINYKIPPYVPEDKIDFELVKNYIIYRQEMKGKFFENKITLSESD